MSLFFRRSEERAIHRVSLGHRRHNRPEGACLGCRAQVVPVYAAVRLIAESVASLPLQQYRKSEPSRTPMPLSQVFQPSRGSLMSWVQQPLVSMLMRGNAYGLKSGLDSQLGGITATLNGCIPDKVKLIDGRWTYLGRVVDDADMLHIPGLSVPGSRLGVSH